MTIYNKTVTDIRDAKLLAIAKEKFSVETLDEAFIDRKDFHSVSVWAMKMALELAWEAGRASVIDPMIRVSKPHEWECEGDSTQVYCSYELYGEDECDHCGEPRERK